MRPSRILNLVALPLVLAMPLHLHRGLIDTAAHLNQRTELAQFNFIPFNLTNMGMECARNTSRDMYACELRFDWFDPNSVLENNITSCSCLYKWSWDGKTTEAGEKNTYSSSYSICKEELPTYFEMKISAFNSSQAFELAIAHRYHDSENFTFPWDYPLTFAEWPVHLPLVEEHENLVRLYDAGPIYANITGIAG